MVSLFAELEEQSRFVSLLACCKALVAHQPLLQNCVLQWFMDTTSGLLRSTSSSVMSSA